MKDLAKKVAVGLATGALVAQSIVLPAFAEITVVITGNGSNTDNEAEVEQTSTTTVVQSNEAYISNDIDAEASTGENDASDNTGANVSIDTGNAKAAVEVNNTVNSNEASVDCGGCPTDVEVLISGNGTHSDNEVELELENTTDVFQTNKANIKNDVDVEAETGDNDASDNTGGDVSIDTGNAWAWAEVNNKANANVAYVGGSGDGALELLILGNGSYSESEIDVDLKNDVTVVQDNWADIENDVDVEAETGDNDASDNTGGSNSIDTGDAKAGALVDTWANLNVAHVEDCCLLDGLIKVAGNGYDSENEVELELESALDVFQDNTFACDKHNNHVPWLELWGGNHKKDGECNDVDVEAETGENDLNDNTGDPGHDPSIDTGNALTEVEVSNTANTNVFTTGDALPDHPDWGWDLDGNWFGWWLFGHLSE